MNCRSNIRTRAFQRRPLDPVRLPLSLVFAVLVSAGWPPPPIAADDPVRATPGVTTAEAVASEQVPAEPSNDAIKASARALSRAFRMAAKDASPSVVTVFSYGQGQPAAGNGSDEDPDLFGDGPGGSDRSEQDDDAKPLLPGPRPPGAQSDNGDPIPLTGLGSGVISDPSGWVITNHHVVQGAQRVVVQLADEMELVATKVHGDAESDVAVLRIEHDEPLPAAKFGDSDALEIGDWVLAIGSPFKLEATVSAGIISAKNRTLRRINRSRMLQTDAAINPGNSGGPLIDLDGRVIAISTAIATRNGGYQGIGFAIPINQAKWIAEELAEFGRVRRAAIGITSVELNRRVAAQVKLPIGLGVLVYQVIDGSAADQAGIQVLDVILEFAGERVRDPRSLREAIERSPVGSTQQVKISRRGEELELDIVLAPREDPTGTEAEAEESE